MPVTIRTAAEQAAAARYRLAVRAYLDTHHEPGLDDQPCTTCAAPARKPCKGSNRLGGHACATRIADHLERVDAHRAAAQEAGHAAAAQQHGTELRR